jgi:hypothetical protein
MMKRMVIGICLVLLVALPAAAAESIVWSVYGGGYENWLEVVSVNTTAANGSLTTTPLKDGSGNILNLSGYYLYQVAVYFGGTAPTDNSDLELLEHDATASGAKGRDILYGAGANMIDAAANNNFKPWVNSAESAMPIYGTLYQKVSNNSVDTAIFTIVYKFIK